MISREALQCSSIIFGGYLLQSSLIQLLYYYIRGNDYLHWKTQTKKTKSINKFYFHPMISSKPDRGPFHRILTTTNLIVATIFALIVSEVSVRQLNKMQFEHWESYGLISIFVDLCIAVTLENVMEYYWHRVMHLPYFYKRFHKMHHFYKAPEPWDDMYIHPVEAFGYYCILYSPPFIFQCHYFAFFGYMIIMGLCGVLDHCGVRLSVPNIYNTEDHDAHHELFEVNYAFPFPYMDLLHGTYQGTFFGRQISCRIPKLSD